MLYIFFGGEECFSSQVISLWEATARVVCTIVSNLIYLLKMFLGMKVLKVGGPVYRIGVGGGAASSVNVQGDNSEELDFGAVQRGDPEMEQKLNRLIRACIELGDKNPICSIHDQGAGGNGMFSFASQLSLFF